MRKIPEVMDEETFLFGIENATGMKLGPDYGFMCGRLHPMMEGTPHGLLSSSLSPGFKVWKRDKEGRFTEREFSPKNQRESQLQIIKFLKEEL